MIEAAFPLLGAAFVVLVVLPAFALLAKVALALLERDEAGGPLHGLNLRYLLLTGSSVLPLAWLCSAGLHQVERGESTLACLVGEAPEAHCFEPGFFALTLGLWVLGCSMAVQRRHRRVDAARGVDVAVLHARIEGLLEHQPMLHGLRGRVVVTKAADIALGTRGWAKPQVFVGAAFAARLSDDMLASALAHECEHLRARDPLRYLLLELALAINPLGRFLLEPHAARWYGAREAHCDREAVVHGALPLSLADAIVRAARPSSFETVALGARDTAMLEFRVRMLVAFAERTPDRCCHRGPSPFPMACVLLMLALLLPHQTGTAALDILHTSAEHALLYFWP
jgi:Zn-dependent protease with chaperone function